MSENKKLSISLLVSGREDTTEKCLDSLRPLLEQLDAELILVDTGCGPKLQEKLRTYTDQIVQFAWCNDFAAARNAGLERATGEWFLYLDDDEWFEDVTPLIQFFQSKESEEYVMALYKARNYGDLMGHSYSDDWVARIFRRTDDNIRFHGKVHEDMEHKHGKCKKIDAFVHHYGYVYRTEEARREHFARNSVPLLEMIEKEPDVPRWRVQMLQEYQSVHMVEAMQQLAEESAARQEGKEHPYEVLVRDNYLVAQLVSLRMQGKLEDLVQTAQAYLEEPGHTNAGLCAIASCAAEAAFDLGLYAQCTNFCRQYFTQYGLCHSSTRDEQNLIIEETMLYIGQRIGQDGYRNICMHICSSLSRENRPEEVPPECRDDAVEYLTKQLNGNADFLKLADQYLEMGIERLIPLEEMFLGLDLAQWMAQVQILERNRQWARWRGLCRNMRKIKTRADIRYAYLFSSYDYALVTQKGITGMGYAAMTEFLRDMTDDFLAYAHAVYTDRAFSGAMEILPKHITAAVYLQKMFACADSDTDGKKQWLSKAAAAWEALAPAAEHYGKLLEQQGKRPLLSIAVMVSNRADTIEKCLQSLAVIRETIPCELLVLDTGCSKELHETLAEYADKLDCFTWCNDFSAARNRTIEMAEGEWYMFLDDDEWFVDVQELVDFFAGGEYREYDSASYIQRNFLDMQGAQYTDAWVTRIVRLTPEMHFESKIHEYFSPGGTKTKGLKSIVHHYGYVFETKEALRRHYERNRTLLLEMIEQEPDNIRWWVLLIQEYRAVNENQKLYDYADECLRRMDGRSDEISCVYLGSFYAAKIAARKAENQWEKGLAECKKALADKRNTPLFRAYAEQKMTGFSYWIGDYDGVEQHGAEFLKLYDFYQENEALLFAHKWTVLVGECFDDVMIKEVYSELILSGLKRGSSANLLKYLDRLEWDKPHAYVFEDMVPTLLELEQEMAQDPGFMRLSDVMSQNTALMEYYLEQKTLLEKRKMSGPIKEQLRLLIANGMKEQAKGIWPSIREMLPEDDAEIQELEALLEDA